MSIILYTVQIKKIKNMETVRDCKHLTRHPLKFSTDGLMITPCCISILEIVESWERVCCFSQGNKMENKCHVGK